MITDEILITHPTGLHARPAVKLTKLAKSLAPKVEIRAVPDGVWVNAASPVKVMGLKLKTGTSVEIRSEGDGAEDAVAAIKGLIERNFDEDV